MATCNLSGFELILPAGKGEPEAFQGLRLEPARRLRMNVGLLSSMSAVRVPINWGKCGTITPSLTLINLIKFSSEKIPTKLNLPIVDLKHIFTLFLYFLSVHLQTTQDAINMVSIKLI